MSTKCFNPLHESDGHYECVTCLGVAHTEAALAGASCPHCEDMSLARLRSRIAFFHEGDPPRSVLPSPLRKKQKNTGGSLSGMSGAATGQRPRTPLSLQRLTLPVCFTCMDQRPSLDASGLVSFGTSEEEIAVDETVSLMTFNAVEWVCSGEEPAAPPPSQSARPSVDSELICVLTRAVEELGLGWIAPEEE